MSTEQTLYSTLKNDAGVSALVGTRIYPLLLPQNPTYPAITYQRISTRPVMTRTGNGLDFVRMQIDCYADSYSGVKALAAAVEAALSTDYELGKTDFYDDTLEIFRVSMDYQFSE